VAPVWAQFQVRSATKVHNSVNWVRAEVTSNGPADSREEHEANCRTSFLGKASPMGIPSWRSEEYRLILPLTVVVRRQ
jgi:hypothetical protein